MKKNGFIKVTPVFNDCRQGMYSAYAQTSGKKEALALSRYFIADIPDGAEMFFVWNSSEDTSRVDLNLSIEKLCRQ